MKSLENNQELYKNYHFLYDDQKFLFTLEDIIYN